MFARGVYARRVEAFFAKVSHLGLGGAVLTTRASCAYFTGFEGAPAVLLARGAEPVVVVPRLEYTRAKKETAYGEVVAYSEYEVEATPYESVRWKRRLWELIGELIAERGLEGEEVGAELSGVRAGLLKEVVKALGSEPKDVSREVEEMRGIKCKEEVGVMERAVKIAEEAMRRALDSLEKGVTELEVAAEIERVFRLRGADRAFEPIVAFGEDSAYPHAKPGSRELREGDLVVIDLGARLAHYCSDITRTLVFGRPSSKQARMVRAVLEAQRAAIEAAKSGTKARDVDRAAREVLRREGLSACFNHGVGHGLGIEVHEFPALNPASEDTLLTGMTVTIEPGVYVEGYGGVRIEDVVLVEEGGCRILSEFERIL